MTVIQHTSNSTWHLPHSGNQHHVLNTTMWQMPRAVKLQCLCGFFSVLLINTSCNSTVTVIQHTSNSMCTSPHSGNQHHVLNTSMWQMPRAVKLQCVANAMCCQNDQITQNTLMSFDIFDILSCFGISSCSFAVKMLGFTQFLTKNILFKWILYANYAQTTHAGTPNLVVTERIHI